MTEQRFVIKDVPELYDASLLSQTNSLAKTPAYARFTWTQSLHELRKPLVTEEVKSIITNFDEDRKRFDKMRQMRFTVSDAPPEPDSSVPKSKHAQPPRKKDPNKTNESQSDDEEDARVRKAPKPTLAARVASGLDRLDQAFSARSPDFVREQVDELTRHTRNKRQAQMRQLSENCDRLFEAQTLLSERTEELHRAFLKRVSDVQSLIHPDILHPQLSTDDPQRKKQKQNIQNRTKKPDSKPNLVKDRYLKIRERERTQLPKLQSRVLRATSDPIRA